MSKLQTLRELVKEYLTYVTKWDSVEVTNGKCITVTWYKVVHKENEFGEVNPYINATSRTFTEDDLDERIKSYRNKISYERSKI